MERMNNRKVVYLWQKSMDFLKDITLINIFNKYSDIIE